MYQNTGKEPPPDPRKPLSGADTVIRVLPISEAADLGIHALAYLARRPDGEPRSAGHIAAKMAVSDAHLATVLQRLNRAGLLRSVRGARGGYVLAAQACSTSLLSILDVLDGPVPVRPCPLERENHAAQPCALCQLEGDIRELVTHQLRNASLQDLAGAKLRLSAVHDLSPERGAITEPQEDPLELLIQGHEGVSEWLVTMWNALGLGQGEGLAALERIRDYFNSFVREHFDYEEQRVFPVLLRVGPKPNTARMVRKLLEEHVEILGDCGRLFAALAALLANSEREPELGILRSELRALVDRVLAHAAYEDDHLLPLVREHRSAFR